MSAVIEVKINGKTISQVGGSLSPQIGIYIGNSRDSKQLKLSINGYREIDHYTTEHREWPEHSLADGDEVAVTIKSDGGVSEPVKSSTFDSIPKAF